jgi:Mn2+/Fe2+ NRAMP family transporter
VSGLLAHPDWGAAAKGLTVPGLPLTRDALYISVATVGTTLAPWGLAFIQSYAVNKRLSVEDLRYERADVVVGAVLTGIIGLFVVVACAATLHASGIHIDDAADAAHALRPLAGSAAATLFALGFLGAALLAMAIVPLSTAYSICEAFRLPADIDDDAGQAPGFYTSYGGLLVVAGAIVLIPGAPLISILVATQALNAVLLLALLPFIRNIAGDPAVMGDHALGGGGRLLTGAALAVVAASVAALGVLAIP